MKKVKGLWKRYMEAEVYTYVIICVFCVSLLFTFLRFQVPLDRTKDSIVDLGLGLATYFVFAFEGAFEGSLGYVPQVPSRFHLLPDIDIYDYLPFTLEELIEKLNSFVHVVFSPDTFVEYNSFLYEMIFKFYLYGVMLVMLCVVVYSIVKEQLLTDKGNAIGFFSKPLQLLLKVAKWCSPYIKIVFEFCVHFYQRRKLFVLFVMIWLLNFNILTIIIEFFAYYFYFLSTFDFSSFFTQVLRTLIDLLIMFASTPWFLWIVVPLGIFLLNCVTKGYERLRQMDGENCGFLKKISYVSLLIGAPGVGKTTLLTSFCLYFVNIYKRSSLDTLFDIEMAYPLFPFGLLRKELDERIRSGVIKDNPTADLYIDSLEETYKNTPSSCFLFGYDIDWMPMERDVGNRMDTLFGSLRTYAEAYYIYSCENPSISNYPIRFDGQFDDSEYFRLWDGDFYNRKPKEMKERSRYSHILDQDILRMGKKVDPNNRNIGCFSWGIYSNSEWGKCRGNQLTTVDVDKADKIANQKNDLYAYSHKMSRHARTTVDNKVYFRFIGDEQRPESLAADQRDLCDIISIVEKSELMLALPYFQWLDKLYDVIYEPFKSFYLTYSNVRGDLCLPVFLMKIGVSAFSSIYKWTYNRFGYYTLTLKKEKGTAYGNSKSGAENFECFTYHLPVMQIYSDRYNTDCYSGFFTKKQLDCKIGINDLECYTGLTMTESQMIAQHDYFLMEIMDMMKERYGEDPPKRSRKSKQSTANQCVFDIKGF